MFLAAGAARGCAPRRRFDAIGWAHRRAGHPSPQESEGAVAIVPGCGIGRVGHGRIEPDPSMQGRQHPPVGTRSGMSAAVGWLGRWNQIGDLESDQQPECVAFAPERRSSPAPS